MIALKPDTNDPLPCVLTLDQSPLEEAKYEIITHGKCNQTFSFSLVFLVKSFKLVVDEDKTNLSDTNWNWKRATLRAVHTSLMKIECKW